MSASCLLDRRSGSCSFQNLAMTHGEAVRDAVEADGGQVIRNRESDKEIKTPLIRYEETTWQFAKRMGSLLGAYIIPDVETGNPNLWFGMRAGKEIPALSEEHCSVRICPMGEKAGTYIQMEGRAFYKIGDWMTFMDQKVTITVVEGRYEHGELTFVYTLEDRETHQPVLCDENHPGGLGLWGNIKEVKGETVSIALDIDNGEETGDYFYPWYPETGNALYAMPEKGAGALLHFFEEEERGGAVIHCLNKKLENERYYKDRVMDIEDGNSIQLKEGVSFNRGGSHTLSLNDGAVSASISKELKIRAEEKIWLKARQIVINTPEELNLCQG